MICLSNSIRRINIFQKHFNKNLSDMLLLKSPFNLSQIDVWEWDQSIVWYFPLKLKHVKCVLHAVRKPSFLKIGSYKIINKKTSYIMLNPNFYNYVPKYDVIIVFHKQLNYFCIHTIYDISFSKTKWKTSSFWV